VTQKQTLSGLDVLCLGVNAIVGSGIYAFPGMLAQKLGPASFLAFAVCGGMSALVGLCFAEAAGMFERSGGPYLYAESAFGPIVGYLVGWSCWVAAVMSWAAVARAIPPYLERIAPALSDGAGATTLAASLCIALGLINYRGVKPGAYTTDILTVAKLVPLFVLVMAGFLSPLPERGAFAPHGLGPLPPAALAAFFAFQGFEVVPVPAGETRNPRRAAPVAVLGSIAGATLLYVGVQWTAATSTPGLAGSKQPLSLMGQHLLGSFGGHMVAAAAVISMVGFCAGVALAGPRYLEPLCADGHLPFGLARRHPLHGTPHLAILVTTTLTCLLVVFLNFAQLVNMSVLTVGVQYLTTCIGVVVLRLRRPDLPRQFRVPLGPVIPILAVLVVAWLGAQARLEELAGFAGMLAVGAVVRLVSRRRRG
jgi:amino acid transporter